MTVSDATTAPVAVGLIGAGAIGAFHAETLARRLPGARLAGVADPAPGAADKLASLLGAGSATTDPAELAAFVDCVRGGATPTPDGQDARAALVIALAAIQSVDTGRPVRLDAVDQP